MNPYQQGNPPAYPAPGSGSGYPAPGYPASGPGYPPEGGNFPGYPPPGGYPPAPGPGGYPPPPGQGGYPPQQPGGYPAPQQPGGYPPQSGGYPPAQQPGGYPPQSGGYPPAQPGGYPPAQPSGYAAPAQPSSPNKQFVSGGLTPGRLINITLTPGPSKFAVNLRHSDGGDIAFHFNPRLPERVVVRNTCINGGWQGEERQQPSFPFVAGQQCNILILCEQSQFKVAVNGQHFIEYHLRTGSLQLIQLVEVTGDLTLGSFYVQ